MKRIMVLFVLIFSFLFVFADGKDDEKACEYARKTNTQKVWRLYLKKFPNGACSFEAESELATGEEQEDKAEPAGEPEVQPSVEPAGNTEPEQKEMKPAEKPLRKAQPATEYPSGFRVHPYRAWGTALIIVGAASIGLMAGASYGASEYALANNYPGWAGYTTASVAFGVLGGGLLATGTALFLIKRKPPENCNVSLNNLSVAPTKDGMFASAGFSF